VDDVDKPGVLQLGSKPSAMPLLDLLKRDDVNLRHKTQEPAENDLFAIDVPG
jgi:hypothetical protein